MTWGKAPFNHGLKTDINAGQSKWLRAACGDGQRQDWSCPCFRKPFRAGQEGGQSAQQSKHLTGLQEMLYSQEYGVHLARNNHD